MGAVLELLAMTPPQLGRKPKPKAKILQVLLNKNVLRSRVLKREALSRAKELSIETCQGIIEISLEEKGLSQGIEAWSQEAGTSTDVTTLGSIGEIGLWIEEGTKCWHLGC